MKTLITSAAFALTIATGAFAAPSNLDLSTIKSFAPNVDVQALTNTEVRGLLNVIHSGDSVSEVRAKVKQIVKG